MQLVSHACSTCATTATVGISHCWRWRAIATCGAATPTMWRLASKSGASAKSSHVRIGIVVGLAAEARIAHRLGWLVATGGGTAAGAEHAARRLIAEGCRALISFGLAGGLDPALRRGTPIVPSTVIANDGHYPTDPDLVRLLGGATQHLILGTDAIVASVAEKR